MTDLERWAGRFPAIRWAELIRVYLPSGVFGYACRICVAEKGLKGSDIPTLPSSPGRVRRHIEEVHSK